MKGVEKNDISFFGEFVDEALEKEFFHYDMKRCSRFMAPAVIASGLIFMSFIIADCYDIGSFHSLMVVLGVRILFLIISVIAYFYIKKTKDYYRLAYLIAAYQIVAIISFVIIIYQYKYISFISFLSVIVITLAVYITPNKLIFAQFITIIFNLIFFIICVHHMENLEISMLWKLIGYDILFISIGNIEAYLINSYKRKQFAYSRELLRLSTTDPLTGICNRVRFNQELSWWIDYCRRYDNCISLVMFDIDDFKKFNDNYGHLIGDSVLKNITSAINEVIRSTDVFARWGGEEFVILLPNTDICQAMEMTERMRICIGASKYDAVENVTCSFGLVTLHKNENAEELLQRVDELLYDAKEHGKNAISCENSVYRYQS